MRALWIAVLMVALAASLAAQYRAVPGAIPSTVVSPIVPFRTYGSPTGFGNILFPGTGTQPPLTNQFFFPFTGPVIGGIRGRGGFGGHSGFGGHRGGSGATTIVPIPYPVPYMGYDPGYAQYADPQMQGAMPQQAPPQQQPNITIVVQQQPPVVVNQGAPESAPPDTAAVQPNTPTIRSYQAPSGPQAPGGPAAAPQEASQASIVFMIALKDNSVYTAVAYWVEGETLHYITTQGRHNQVSLDLVDRALCDRLNEDSKVPFHLPAPKQ